MRLLNAIQFQHFRGDLFGGITAAIVALPLALAFGVSSGAGAIAGLYGAILVGFFAALFGGTPSQVSGPTGPMTVVMTTVFTALVARHPDTGAAMAFTVVLLGGLFQILFGVLRLGKYITLMPYTVISGFMSGVGLIIILLQLPPLLGYMSTGEIWGVLVQLPTYLTQPRPAAFGLGLLTLTIVFAAPPKLNRIFPAPLLALIVGTLVSMLFGENPEINRIGSIPSGLPTLQLPTFALSELKDMMVYGLMLGVLGSIDSLLTSLVADSVTRTQHDSDKELIGQGIGNCIAGLLGGLPGAGATMRTVTNVQAGGRTALSGMIHALVLLTITLWASPLTTIIPHAVLAGILLKVGIDIIDWGFIKRAHRISLKTTGLMYLVMALTVFVDLITAVAVGVFIANLLTVKKLSDLQSSRVKAVTEPTNELSLTPLEQSVLSEAKGRILLFQLGGPMSFGAAKVISQRMRIVKDYEVLILDVSDVPMLGVTAALAIETMVEDAVKKRHHVFLVGAYGGTQQRLGRLEIDRFPEVHQVENRLEALQTALALMQSSEPIPIPNPRQ
ncbi:sodium-independent anion transporter [filamentous cyanobacterium CCP2]|nr:sodium-independent anion transporter [filamentous cyanobacterium CCP2]